MREEDERPSDPKVEMEVSLELESISTVVLAIDTLPLTSRRAVVAYLCEKWAAEGLLLLYMTQGQRGLDARRSPNDWD